MRRGVVLGLGISLFAAGCGAPAETAVARPASSSSVASPSAAAPAGPVPSGDSRAEIRAACRSVDAAYQELDDEAKARLFEGVDAEGRGDKEGVRKALAALRPVFTTMATTFREAAGRVTDLQVRDALILLAEAADKELTFTTFAEFNSIQAMVTPAETSLKRACYRAGSRLQNVE